MTQHLRANLWLLGLTVLLCTVLYPLTLWAVGRPAFPRQAEGNLVVGPDGKPVGSRLIAQAFASDEYFWPRPSAVSYNAAASGASNWGASNPALRKRVEEEIARLRAKNPAASREEIPADLVMASGSGLDPHITLKGALYQLDRVATAWAEKTKAPKERVVQEIRALLEDEKEAPLGGLAGVDLVNVLEVNQALADRVGRLNPAP